VCSTTKNAAAATKSKSVWPKIIAMSRCSFCHDHGRGELDEILADLEKGTYLCQCPVCLTLWAGNFRTPTLWIPIEFSWIGEFFPAANAQDLEAIAPGPSICPDLFEVIRKSPVPS